MPEQVTSLDSPSAEPVSQATPSVRQADANDLPTILKVLDTRPTHFVEAAKEWVREAFSNHRTILSVIESKVVGFLIWSTNDKEIELLWMAVDPEWSNKGIGSELVRWVMSTASTQTRIFLRTATTDSVIPDTQFEGKAYEATNRFFLRFGFVNERIDRDFWGSSNHSLVMGRPLNPLNPMLARLAPLVRRLQKEIGRAYGVDDAYVGIAFRHDTECAVFFAEFVLAETATQSTSEEIQYVSDEYVLPCTMKFVQLVLDSIEDSQTYDLENPGNMEVEGDLRKRWGQDTQRVHVFRIPLGSDAAESSSNAVLYLVSKVSLGEELRVPLSKSASLVAQVLRTALFLGGVAPHDTNESRVREVAEKLSQNLPRFDEYERQFQGVIRDLTNPTAWFTHRFAAAREPKVTLADSAPECSPEEERLLKAIRNAFEITVREMPEGSFQRKKMRFVTIQPQDPGGVKHGAPYDAIVKEVDLEKAQKEQIGYQRAQFYFKDISFALAPAANLWPVPDNDEGTESRFASVIPRVSGQTLTRYVREKWCSFKDSTESAGDHFGRIYRTLVAFTRGLGQGEVQDPREVTHQCLYDSHLGSSPDCERRMPKTIEALGFYLDSLSDTPLLRFQLPNDATDVINPLWVLNKVKKGRIGPYDTNFWLSTDPLPVTSVYFCHGDFHAGNIIVREDGTVTVLDYDYVNRDRRFLDIATLEASFLLSLSSADDFKEESRWLVVFPSLLSGLAGQEALGRVPRKVLENYDAFNAWRVVQEGRVWVANEGEFPIYRALVASALLRLFASNHKYGQNNRYYHPGLFSTALFYIGSLLKRMIKLSSTTVREVDLYVS